jgi:hypothetical protein
VTVELTRRLSEEMKIGVQNGDILVCEKKYERGVDVQEDNEVYCNLGCNIT